MKKVYSFGGMGSKGIRYPKSEDNKMHLIMQDSSKAVCGWNEREVTIKAKNKIEMIKHLKEMGKHVVGTSYEPKNSRTVKIWYT